MPSFLRILVTLLTVSTLFIHNVLGADLQDGDIIFQTSRSSQSLAIQKATGSKYSHMGIIIHRNGYPHVFEAEATVRYTPLSEWISHGVGGKYEVKRLRNANSMLTGESLSKLRRIAEEYRGKPYDPYFEWSDKRIYCSELVWKIYKRTLDMDIGKLQKLRDFKLTDPVVRKALRQRYGKRIPLDQQVISPVAMYNSRHLVTIAQE